MTIGTPQSPTISTLSPATSAQGVHDVVSTLAGAFRDGAVARWLEPDADSRGALAEGYFAAIVQGVLATGDVMVATTGRVGGDPDGTGPRVGGVALWLRHDPEAPPDRDSSAEGQPIPADVLRRLAVLRDMLDARRPAVPHHYLAYLAVHPVLQGNGIGSALLARRHAALDALDAPAYLEADDPRNRDLYLRHGYTAEDPVVLPDGPPLWPMWRDPRGVTRPGGDPAHDV